MPIIPLVIGAALSFFGLQLDWYYAFNPEQGPSFGAFGDPFISIQLAENPSNGDCLFSDGTNNYWDAGCSGGSGSSFSTTSANWWASLGLAFSTTSADYWETQQAARGGSGGSGNVATSTTESAGALAYWTSSGATPATLGNVATTTLTASSPLSLSNTVWKVGGSNSVLTLDTSGTWTGNAGTATALAANGSNCTAGSYALGVDASGSSEGCTDATTEIDSAISTHTGDAEAHQALVTLAGTPDYLTITGQQITRGTIDIGDDTNLTAGDGLTLTGDDLDCDTASGSVFGCLSAANWTTFNSKLSSYDAWTHPVAGVSATTSTLRLAGLNASSTVLFDNATSTLFTATTAWLTNVFIGADTLAEYISDTAGAFFTGNTETGVTVTYQDADNTVDVVCDTASGSAFGCLTAANWTIFNNKVSTTSIDTITEVETLWGGINVLTETEIDASSELAAIMDDETGTGGALVFASSPSITSPTLTTFFGTPCTGQNFLQDISDTGAFTCGAASGSSGNMSGWATTTVFGSQLLLYPVDAATTDVSFGTNSTTTAPFWWDVSATSTYIGNGGTGSSTLQFGTAGYEWLMGFDGSDNAFKISSSTVERGFSVSNVLSIAKATLLSTFNFAVTIVGNLTLSANLIFDGQTFDSFTDDATLTNNAGDLQVVDVTCTNCLGGTEIDESTLVITGFLSSYDAWTHPLAGVSATTSALDLGGASFLEIPNGTNPTADDVGELAHDTTDNQLILDDFVVAKATDTIWKVTVASTSPAFISGGLLAFPAQLDGYTITAIRCYVSGGTSKIVAIEDASANSTEDITCGTTLTSDDGSITNATFTAGELGNIDFGNTSGAVDYVTISVFGTWTRE